MFNNRLGIAVAAVLAVAVGGVLVLGRLTSVGPPATPSSVAPPYSASPPVASPPAAAPSVEGTWDVSFTRQEMLNAGIVDSLEDDPSNYGHFRLTFQGGQALLRQLSPLNGDYPGAYTISDTSLVLFNATDGVTFRVPFAVTDTTLTIGAGGPVTFRVKPWTRVATEPIPSSIPAVTLGPGASVGPTIDAAAMLPFGTYDGPTLQVTAIVAAADADPTLTPADRTQIVDVLFAIKGKTTWSASIELRGGGLTQRQTVDGVTEIGSSGTYTLPDDHTLVYTEQVNGAMAVTVFELTVSGTSFTLHRTSVARDAADEFVTRILFESGPFVLR